MNSSGDSAASSRVKRCTTWQSSPSAANAWYLSPMVISRAGASSVADISVIGRPSILIPFAAATADHQTANARGLVDANAAILIPESALDPASLSEQILAVLTTPGAAARMRENALAQGIPDATERLAALVEDLAERKPR